MQFDIREEVINPVSSEGVILLRRMRSLMSVVESTDCPSFHSGSSKCWT